MPLAKQHIQLYSARLLLCDSSSPAIVSIAQKLMTHKISRRRMRWRWHGGQDGFQMHRLARALGHAVANDRFSPSMITFPSSISTLSLAFLQYHTYWHSVRVRSKSLELWSPLWKRRDQEREPICSSLRCFSNDTICFVTSAASMILIHFTA